MTAFDRDHAHDFLTGMYAGRNGLVQICATGKWVGKFFPTTADGLLAAVDYAERLDRGQPKGIYFRATTVKAQPGKDERGGAADTLDAPFLWADLDFGTDGHKGANLPPTAEDAEALIAEAGLPAPSVLIHSGGGLYPLWKRSQAAWAGRLSVNIQAVIEVASAKHGWSYGTGISDMARVLRLPGSVNRKVATPRPCRVIGGSGLVVADSALPWQSPTPVASRPVRGISAARTTPAGGSGSSGGGVFDALDETASWADILEPAGWECVGDDHLGELWLRPGGESEYSARAFEHNLVCHSENAGLPSGSGQRLTKGRVYAWLHHGGDLSAAARELIQGGPAASLLPPVVLDAIQAAADPWAWADLPSAPITGRAPSATATKTSTPATGDEVASFLATFTAYRNPRKLGRRIDWACSDGAPRLRHHALALVTEVIDGHYPADRGLRALETAYRHTGGTDPGAPHQILSIALGAVLSRRSERQSA